MNHVIIYGRVGDESYKVSQKEYLHAEVDAIIKCKNISRAESIHVYRYSESGKPLIAKPCPICMSVIKKSGIKKIFFTKTENN